MSSHEILWTPWRAKWVGDMSTSDKSCPFCRPASEEPSIANLIVHRTASGLVVMNLYPYSGGHLMVVPVRHVPRLRDLDASERADLLELLVRAQDVLERTHHPQGFNIGINEGKIAGAGIAEHMHWHIVPRWEGDASFLTTVAGTRIVPEDIASCWTRVREAFESV